MPRPDDLTYVPWTEWEDRFIRTHYPGMTIGAIARALHRPYVATKGHVRYMRQKGVFNDDKNQRPAARNDGGDSRSSFLRDMHDKFPGEE